MSGAAENPLILADAHGNVRRIPEASAVEMFAVTAGEAEAKRSLGAMAKVLEETVARAEKAERERSEAIEIVYRAFRTIGDLRPAPCNPDLPKAIEEIVAATTARAEAAEKWREKYSPLVDWLRLRGMSGGGVAFVSVVEARFAEMEREAEVWRSRVHETAEELKRLEALRVEDMVAVREATARADTAQAGFRAHDAHLQAIAEVFPNTDGTPLLERAQRTRETLAKVGARYRELRLMHRALVGDLRRHKRFLDEARRSSARRKHGAQITASIERELRAALESATRELYRLGADERASAAHAALSKRCLLDPPPGDSLEEKLGQHLAGLLEEHEGSSPEIRERLARRLHALFNGPMESPETERVFVEAAEKIEAICARNKTEVQETGATRALDALRALGTVEVIPAEASGDSEEAARG